MDNFESDSEEVSSAELLQIFGYTILGDVSPNVLKAKRGYP